MIPDGDRRQTSESRRVVDEIEAPAVRHHDVVRVLVLHHDVGDDARRIVLQRPANDLVERPLRRDLSGELGEHLGREPDPIFDLHL